MWILKFRNTGSTSELEVQEDTMLLFLPADPALPAGVGGSDRPMEL
jgi:hypothetical protein